MIDQQQEFCLHFIISITIHCNNQYLSTTVNTLDHGTISDLTITSGSTVNMRMEQKLDELELDITRVVLCHTLLRA